MKDSGFLTFGVILTRLALDATPRTITFNCALCCDTGQVIKEENGRRGAARCECRPVPQPKKIVFKRKQKGGN